MDDPDASDVGGGVGVEEAQVDVEEAQVDLEEEPGVEAQVNIRANVVHGQQQQRWQTGLFECDQDNCEAFCWSACMPCLSFACIADIVDQGETGALCHCLLYLVAANFGLWWAYAGWYRGKLRARYGLQEAPLPDWITHLLFHWCALAQEYRELAIRGYDVSEGWDGRPKTAPPQQPQGAPPVQQPMTRAPPPA